jgi:hypothetical protein
MALVIPFQESIARVLISLEELAAVRVIIVDEGELKTLVNPESIVKKWSNPSENPSENLSLKETNLLRWMVPEVEVPSIDSRQISRHGMEAPRDFE